VWKKKLYLFKKEKSSPKEYQIFKNSQKGEEKEKFEIL